MVLGVAARTGARHPGAGRGSSSAELHRTLSLFAVAFLVLHVVTAILDPYVTIGWAATVLPVRCPATGRSPSAWARWPSTSAARSC